jgi:hypothetical protein
MKWDWKWGGHSEVGKVRACSDPNMRMAMYGFNEKKVDFYDNRNRIIMRNE